MERSSDREVHSQIHTDTTEQKLEVQSNNSIGLLEIMDPHFKEMKMDKLTRAYYESRGRVMINTRAEERSGKYLLPDGDVDIERVLNKEFGEDIVSWTRNGDELIARYNTTETYLGTGSDEINLLELIPDGGLLDKGLLRHQKERCSSVALTNLGVNIGNIRQIALPPSASDWVNRVKSGRGNCMDASMAAYLLMTTYPVYTNYIKEVKPIGYQGSNFMQTGSEGHIQHFGVAYITIDDELVLMPGGGPSIRESGIEEIITYQQDGKKVINRDITKELMGMLMACKKHYPEHSKKFMAKVREILRSHEDVSTNPNTDDTIAP